MTQWCLSSIPGILCPSNVDKSTQPCPLLSSSLTSTLLISNINNHTDIVSYSKEEYKVTDVLSSSLDHPYDYYTNKRIEQLHIHMDDIQNSSFIKFINYHLSVKNKKESVKNLSEDLSNGHILIDLIEIFSSTKLKREYGRTRFHSLTNVQYVLDYLKLHMQHINISPHDIVSGNRKQILALLWIIMKIFDFPSFRITTNKHFFNENTLISFGEDRSILLKWINNLLNKILNTHVCIYIKDFYLSTWMNNTYLLLIIKYLCPLSSKYGTLEYFEYLKKFDEKNSSFELSLNLSNYCFNTKTIMDYNDSTEKSLFRFFSELQQNILYILKSNQIGKLMKINPYTKQLFDTLLETIIIDPSETINDDEDYLICTEKENLQSDSPNHELLKEEPQDIIPIEESKQIISSEESNVNNELLSLQEQRTYNPTLDDCLQNRSCRLKTKRSPISFLVPPSTLNNDLFLKLIEYYRDPKMIVFKYIFIFVCLCFSILIIIY